MTNQNPNIDKWILSEPGGPAGPFYGIVTQSGRVIALQIVEREHAEILRTIGNILIGDYDTVEKAGKHLAEILHGDNIAQINGMEDYMIRTFTEVILGLANKE